MLPLDSRLIEYLRTITGESPRIGRPSAKRVDQLPLYLRERYSIRSIRIFGGELLVALEGSDWAPGSPKEYGSHARILQEKIESPVAIVIPAIPSYARNRMVQTGVPFIVPGSQLFLPFLMADLRERFGRIPSAPAKFLTPAAQCIVLYQLLRGSLGGDSLRGIAGKIGYSAMMMSRARIELEAAGLCTADRDGRSIVLEFEGSGRGLWDRAEPVLSSPVRKIHWLTWDAVSYPAIPAGITALSGRTIIEDDPVPTFALTQESYRLNLGKDLYQECPASSEADVQVQAWSYNPLLLGKNEGVDSLSLYLSLRSSADERIQQQLETLIGGVEWA